MWLLAFACSSSPDGTVRHAPPSPAGPVEPAEPDDHEALDSGPPQDTAGACPAGMVLVGETVCVDRWEAYLVDRSPFEVPVDGVAATAAGVVPQAYVSGEVADSACQAAGKRLCTSDEWLLACRGAENRLYPYGDVYDATACNDTRASHPVVDLFGDDTTWSTEQLNDPRLNQLPDSLAQTGEFAACATPDGVFDMHGNLHEWVSDADGTFRGGFYVDAVLNGPGCTYATTAHDRYWHDYSTGFRCCADS